MVKKTFLSNAFYPLDKPIFLFHLIEPKNPFQPVVFSVPAVLKPEPTSITHKVNGVSVVEGGNAVPGRGQDQVVVSRVGGSGGLQALVPRALGNLNIFQAFVKNCLIPFSLLSHSFISLFLISRNGYAPLAVPRFDPTCIAPSWSVRPPPSPRP